MLNDLFSVSNDNKSVYIHNLSGFDGMFILKELADISSNFKIIKKEDKIISLTVVKPVSIRGKITPVKLIFKDSLLMLLHIFFPGRN